MRKIADLFLDKRIGKNDLVVKTYENMREEDQSLVEDLMRNSKVSLEINRACKDVFTMAKTEKDVEIANTQISLGGTSIESKIKVVITLLKDTDENDLKISLYSLIQSPV